MPGHIGPPGERGLDGKKGDRVSRKEKQPCMNIVCNVIDSK